MKWAIIARTSGLATSGMVHSDMNLCFVIRSRPAEEKITHAVTVKGDPEPVGNLHLLKKMFVFPNRSMKLILIRRNLSPVLLSAGFLLLH